MRFTAIFTMMSIFLLSACSSDSLSYESLPEGDATQGEALFVRNINGAPACNTCHTLTDERLIGPSLAGYGALAGTRVEGQSAEEYTFHSIYVPGDFIVDSFGNLMYTEYRFKLSEQEVADLITFLLTQ